MPTPRMLPQKQQIYSRITTPSSWSALILSALHTRSLLTIVSPVTQVLHQRPEPPLLDLLAFQVPRLGAHVREDERRWQRESRDQKGPCGSDR